MTGGSVGELREDVPLKAGAKTNRLLCSCSEDCVGGSKFINASFTVLSAIITVALLVQIYYGDYQVVPHGSVATDSRECSEIGSSILKRGGNAVDAAVASAFCLAVINPHTTGLDAKGQMLIYNHNTRKHPIVVSFNQATTNNNSGSANIPNLVRGMVYSHRKYGRLSWRDLIIPTINIARNGFLVPKTLINAIESNNAKHIFGDFIEAGQRYVMLELARTLEAIANRPEKDLFNNIPVDSNYISESLAIDTLFKSYKVYVPENGAPLLSNLRYIENGNLLPFPNADISEHYIYNMAKIAQTVYNEANISAKFDSGTSSNIAIIDKDDLYVSLISGMHLPFGVGALNSQGYFTDVERSIPSSRLPLILVDNDYICGKRIVLGAHDVAMASQIIASLLLKETNIIESIEAPRFNLLSSGEIGLEDLHHPVFSDAAFADLISLMNRTNRKAILVAEPYNSCNVVQKIGDTLSSHADSRGGGIASRY